MEAAGLAIGVVGVAALFTTCIESFDIVVRAREFGEEFDLLCTQLALQRVRLVLWGETLGFASDAPGPYRRRLEGSDIAPAIESTLHHLRSLLQRADLITGRYTSSTVQQVSQVIQVQPSKGLTIFSERFDAFKTRLRQNQQDKSTWTVTRWAVHDLSKFRAIITSIKDLIDGLEGITSAIGLLERQQALLAQEVDAISDAQSLHLLHDLASSDQHSPSIKLVSDAASARLSIFSDSHSTGPFRSRRPGSSRSYRTALSQRFDAASVPSLVEELTEDELSVHTAAEDGTDMGEVTIVKPKRNDPSVKVLRQDHTRKPGGSGREPKPHDKPRQHQETVPQNQRLMADVMKKSASLLPKLRFDCGSSSYGNAITPLKTQDADKWARQSTQFLVHADKGVSSARRIFLELRSIKYANVPFISAAPLGDSLDKMVATIEGPPDTPYEGGVFRILVSFSPVHEAAPPDLRFLTRIYHPNIDCNGNICAAYHSWWNDLEQIGTSSTPTREAWFSARKSNWYTVGALLTALCALLASPNVEDPLVLEIAETYVRSFADYCDAARLYTRKYATRDAPIPEYLKLFGVSEEDWAADSVSPNPDLTTNGAVDRLWTEKKETPTMKAEREEQGKRSNNKDVQRDEWVDWRTDSMSKITTLTKVEEDDGTLSSMISQPSNTTATSLTVTVPCDQWLKNKGWWDKVSFRKVVHRLRGIAERQEHEMQKDVS